MTQSTTTTHSSQRSSSAQKFEKAKDKFRLEYNGNDPVCNGYDNVVIENSDTDDAVYYTIEEPTISPHPEQMATSATSAQDSSSQVKDSELDCQEANDYEFVRTNDNQSTKSDSNFREGTPQLQNKYKEVASDYTDASTP
ncbi:hypothetical protein EB796_000840 [Bugula neritina]|uniref:Uncharacterized protein n=1 Tax=Bugula neritina TaxID=10212 RepID=A0A7J7KRT8_BUGNE|nr:hypothetical protein EB796_000840 [Bugula neritina]